MALIVEDGTGLPNADALISVAFADAYHQKFGNTAWAGDDSAKEGATEKPPRHQFGINWKSQSALPTAWLCLKG